MDILTCSSKALELHAEGVDTPDVLTGTIRHFSHQVSGRALKQHGTAYFPIPDNDTIKRFNSTHKIQRC